MKEITENQLIDLICRDCTQNYFGKDCVRWESCQRLSLKLGDMKIVPEKTTLDEINEFKLRKKEFYKAERHSDCGYGDNDYNTYHRADAYDCKDVEDLIKLYKKLIKEIQGEK